MQERTGAGASRRLPLSSAYLRPVLRLFRLGDWAVRPCGGPDAVCIRISTEYCTLIDTGAGAVL